MLSQIKHYALFILIRPGLDRMGRDLPRGKITASHLEEEKNIEFGIWVISNFFSPKKQPCQISRVRQTLLTDLAVAEVIFFASKTPITVNE